MQIHIPINDVIEEAIEVVVTIIMVVTVMQDNITTKMDATRSGTSIRDLLSTIIQEK